MKKTIKITGIFLVGVMLGLGVKWALAAYGVTPRYGDDLFPKTDVWTPPAQTQTLAAGVAGIVCPAIQVGGLTSLRIHLVNTGATNALTAAQVQFSSDSTFPASAGNCDSTCDAVNTVTFGDEAAGENDSLGLTLLSNWIRVVATSTGGTTTSCRLVGRK